MVRHQHKRTPYRKIVQKILLYGLTIAAAIWILNTPVIEDMMLRIVPLRFLAEFVAGALYTTILTVPLSIVLLAPLSEVSHIYFIAAIGGIGAVFGDFLLMNVIGKLRRTIPIRHDYVPASKNPLLKPLFIAAGVLCLVLPTPDELAMALLGIHKISLRTFILIVYPAKALGIYLMTLSAHTLFM